jgi:hypothetical protein
VLLCLQDISSLSAPLTANLHELLESVKHLAHKVLAPSSTPSAADGSGKQLLSELAGELLGVCTSALPLVQQQNGSPISHQQRPLCPAATHTVPGACAQLILASSYTQL